MTRGPFFMMDNLCIALSNGRSLHPAVDRVSLAIDRGEVVGLVGESGSGKSLCALAIAGLLAHPMIISGGRIFLEGVDLTRLSAESLRKLRGNQVSIIFQEPMTALNPLMSIGDQIGEMFVLHHGLSRRAARERAIAALEEVQVPAARRRVDDYPHQLSGGMRQRVMIAIALACDPALLIADEATTALDVTLQAEIIALILDLCRRKGTAVLMISHDLGLVARTCSRVAVMYAGRIVEEQPARALFSDPRHPYTRALVGALPRLGLRRLFGQQRLSEIPGLVPRISEYPRGCRFAPRCPIAEPICEFMPPEPTSLPSGGETRCHLHG
jgi:peptide/nickel transport system ATP-binding protein